MGGSDLIVLFSLTHTRTHLFSLYNRHRHTHIHAHTLSSSLFFSLSLIFYQSLWKLDDKVNFLPFHALDFSSFNKRFLESTHVVVAVVAIDVDVDVNTVVAAFVFVNKQD